MLLTTTSVIDGKQIVKYHGLVSGEAILGANIFRDLFAGIRDIVGGRSAAYEKELRRAKELAIQEMTDQAQALGANAIVGIDLDYETVGQGGSMLMVSANGTAVTYSSFFVLRSSFLVLILLRLGGKSEDVLRLGAHPVEQVTRFPEAALIALGPQDDHRDLLAGLRQTE